MNWNPHLVPARLICRCTNGMQQQMRNTYIHECDTTEETNNMTEENFEK